MTTVIDRFRPLPRSAGSDAGRIPGAVAAVSAMLTLALGACGGGNDAPSAFGVEPAAAAASVAQVEVSSGRPRARPYDRRGVTSIAMAPDGSALAVATSDGAVRLLDPATTLDQRVLKSTGGAATAVLLFSADSKNLLSGGRDSVVKVFSVANGEVPLTLRGLEGGLRAVAASASGELVASAGEETRVMLWSGTTGRLLKVLRGSTDFVNALSLTADGSRIAAGGADSRIQVWDTATGKLLQTLRAHANPLSAVAFRFVIAG